MIQSLLNVNFRVRELGEWVTKTSDDYFKGKRVVVFRLIENLIYTYLF